MIKQSRSVVVVGYIGNKGTAVLADNFKEKIEAHYPLYLCREAMSFGEDLGNVAESMTKIVAAHFEECGCEKQILEIGEGGLLTALWNLGKEYGCGYELDLRKIPIRQETIEICELLAVNPYHLCSYGALITIVPEGQVLVEKLTALGINAVSVGRTNDTKAHILNNDGTVSHINRPEPDELVRLGLI